MSRVFTHYHVAATVIFFFFSIAYIMMTYSHVAASRYSTSFVLKVIFACICIIMTVIGFMLMYAGRIQV